MHPALAPAHATYERTADALLDEIDALSPAQRSFRPDDDTWSLTMLLHHLVLVDQGIAHGLGGLDERKRKPRLKQRLLAPLVKLILRSPLRVKAPTPAVLPDPDLGFEEVVSRWRAARADLAAGFDEIGAEALDVPVFLHPIGGPQNPAKTLAFLTDHLTHHHHQVRRLRQHPDFPAA